jgi:hypothetical protein
VILTSKTFAKVKKGKIYVKKKLSPHDLNLKLYLGKLEN